MGNIKDFDAQGQSHWLALVASLIIVSGTLALTFLLPAQSQAFEHSSTPDNVALTGDYRSPQQCRNCHASEFQDWSGTSHADASFDPVFQLYFQQSGEKGECFSCHTTGYNQTTGRFVLAGVTCEACHGPYREGHSAESMMIDQAEDLCGTCHPNTLAEWASSRHGREAVTCTDCHEMHTQKPRSAENTNNLCAGCHRDQTQNQTHIIHTQAETGVLCIDCHLAQIDRSAGNFAQGQAATGHAFTVTVNTCDDCHATPLHLPDASP